MKKIFVSTLTALLLLIVLASTVFAARTASGQQLHLKGSLRIAETQQAIFPNLYVSAIGSGNATQLGLFTISSQAQVNIPTLASFTSATLVAADGANIFTEGSGQGTLTEIPGVISIVETYTITGGTGRFSGAIGSFTVERLVDRATLASSGTIQGNILLP